MLHATLFLDNVSVVPAGQASAALTVSRFCLIHLQHMLSLKIGNISRCNYRLTTDIVLH